MEMDPVNRRWYEQICQCRGSGLSDRQWCMEHGISLSTFYRHVQKLRSFACDLPAKRKKVKLPVMQEVVELQVLDGMPEGNSTSPAGTTTLKAGLQPHKAATPEQETVMHFFRIAMCIHLPGDISIEVSDLANPSPVAGVIRSLEGAC